MRRALVAAMVVWVAAGGWARAQSASGPSVGDGLPAPAVSESVDGGVPDAASAAGCCTGSGCDGCAHTDCGWVSGEYLLWYYHHAPLPPLVTAGTPPSSGVLGQSGTTVLFGGDEERNQPASGARVTVGYWLDDCKSSSVELSGFFLGWRTEPFVMAGNDGQVLARPFVNAATGTAGAFPVAFDSAISGDVLVSNRDLLYGVEANYVSCLCRHPAEQLNLCGCCLCCYQVDCLLGFRYLNFQENLDEVQNSSFAPGLALLPGDTLFLADSFATRTQFWGPQAGFDAVVYQGPIAFELRGKLAVGASDETVSRLGETAITGPGGAGPVMPGGFYVSPGALGRSTRVDLAVVPEVSFNIGYRFSDHLAGYVGYNLLYWTAVARAGDQVNESVNFAQSPIFGGGAAAPRVPASVTTTDMWVQGLTVGVEFTW